MNGAQKLLDWFVADAIPLWASHGYDHENGGFFEALDFNGLPLAGRPRRVRAQARQIYTFSRVGVHEWHRDAEPLAAIGFEYFLEKACPDNGKRGCVHLLADDGSVLDDRRDLYDQAFLLLACAGRWEASRDARALDLARQTIAFLDSALKSADGGWLESDRSELPRRQNPHMHLFEAFMELYRVSGDDNYLGYADHIYQLFCDVFFDDADCVIREFFDVDWSPITDQNAIEPGHMFEWVWLLGEYSRLKGVDTERLQSCLFNTAAGIGADSSFHGFAVNRTSLNSENPHGAKRLWPQTEYVRATVMRKSVAEAANLSEALLATYLNVKKAGLWMDEFNAAGQGIAKDVPASVLYHLLGPVLAIEKQLQTTDAALVSS